MTEYDNTGRGALFVSDRKKTLKDPDYSGNINIGGKEFWLSGWKKTSAAGKQYLSLSAKEKTAAKPEGKNHKLTFQKEIGF